MATHILGVDASTITFAAPMVVVGAVAVSLGLRTRRARAVRSLAADWPNTRGTVMSATVQVSHNGGARHESPLVLYTYQVNGQVFQGQRVRVGDEYGRVRVNGAASSAASTVARYPAGSCVEVFYDPANPARSALER
jgi:hypothetical protein